MRARRWIPVASAVVAIAAVVALFESNVPPQMHWKFLDGHKVTDESVDEAGWSAEGEFADLSHYGNVSNRDGPALQSRLQHYVFRADYDAVVAAARSEVLARGGWEDAEYAKVIASSKAKMAARGQDPRFLDMVMFRTGNEWWMLINRSPHGGPAGPEDRSQPYVRVSLCSIRQENFAGVARRWLRARLH